MTGEGSGSGSSESLGINDGNVQASLELPSLLSSSFVRILNRKQRTTSEPLNDRELPGIPRIRASTLPPITVVRNYAET